MFYKRSIKCARLSEFPDFPSDHFALNNSWNSRYNFFCRITRVMFSSINEHFSFDQLQVKIYSRAVRNQIRLKYVGDVFFFSRLVPLSHGEHGARRGFRRGIYMPNGDFGSTHRECVIFSPGVLKFATIFNGTLRNF